MIKKIVLTLSLAALVSCTPDKPLSEYNGKTVRLKETLSLVGNRPFQKPAITYQGQTVFLKPTKQVSQKELYQYISKRVELSGKLDIKELKIALSKASVSQFSITVETIKAI